MNSRRAEAGPHRSFATRVLEKMGDPAKAQRLAPRTDPKTTALHDQRHEHTDRLTVDELSG
jgi:hypothetical protein